MKDCFSRLKGKQFIKCQKIGRFSPSHIIRLGFVLIQILIANMRVVKRTKTLQVITVSFQLN